MRAPIPDEALPRIYALDAPISEWQSGVVELLAHVVPPGLGRFGYAYSTDASGAVTVPAGIDTLDGLDPDTVARSLKGLDALSTVAGIQVPLWERVAADALSNHLARLGAPEVLESLAEHGVADSLAICGGNPGGVGFVFGSFQSRRSELRDTDRQLWLTLASHVAAATRLRERLGGSRALEQAAAIWADGHLTHDTGVGRDLEALDAAVTRLESSPTVDRWNALVAGHFSVVQVVDTDGRRFIVALANPPHARPFARLTRRQAQVLELFLQGHSLTFIGYELGLAASSVSHHMTTIRRTLGAPNDAALIERVGALLAFRTRGKVEGFEVLEALTRRLELSPTESELVQGLRDGLTDAELATLRQVSVKTVRNQLHRLYRKNGVHSRVELLTFLNGTDQLIPAN